jgi:hypothetical protein
VAQRSVEQISPRRGKAKDDPPPLQPRRYCNDYED